MLGEQAPGLLDGENPLQNLLLDAWQCDQILNAVLPD
jgi:hypothetical protein